MIKTLLIFLFFISSIFPQSEEIELPPDKGVEYKLNDLSGAIFDEVSKEPLEDVNVDLFTGNKVLKHSLLR